jgi:flagellar biosynthesis protein FliQ
MRDFDMTLEPLRVFLAEIGAALPRVLIAIAVVVVGWMLAKLARFAVERALRAVNFGVLSERSGLDAFLRSGGMRTDTTRLLAVLAYWLVILAALVIAFNSLGLAAITDLIGRVLVFVPRLMLALLILTFGAYFARFVENAVSAWCRGVELQDGDLLGRVARYAILVFVVMMALDQAGVGGDVVRQSFLILLAGVVFAVALAFGLGGKDWAADLLERWWPRRK